MGCSVPPAVSIENYEHISNIVVVKNNLYAYFEKFFLPIFLPVKDIDEYDIYFTEKYLKFENGIYKYKSKIIGIDADFVDANKINIENLIANLKTDFFFIDSVFCNYNKYIELVRKKVKFLILLDRRNDRLGFDIENTKCKIKNFKDTKFILAFHDFMFSDIPKKSNLWNN